MTMKNLKRFIAFLIILSGIGHICIALIFDNQSMFMQMIGGGIIYLILGVLVWQGNKRSLIITKMIMLLAGIGSSLTINEIGYPVNVMFYFVGLNCTVILLSAVYLFRMKFVYEQTIREGE
ncbi:hypothetical protein [Tepidibacter hydrothermalis]|uniref:Uncharacterized protein n=1 Tax=Tepidibacter hydrothermalis TaxID=3036126 RepID=A0ABY8EFS5_9FIRM|nr:hypothetical protein [Tepidibacter hydrothermalis]WFD11798.1 hypothetical protein P4S50_06900 [Tepidibacter hydrothermalis]